LSRSTILIVLTTCLLIGCDLRSGVEVGFYRYSGWGDGPYIRVERELTSVYGSMRDFGDENTCRIEEDSTELINRWVSLVPAEYSHLSAVEFLGMCADEERREVTFSWVQGNDDFKTFSVRWSMLEECRPNPELPDWIESISVEIEQLLAYVERKCGA